MRDKVALAVSMVAVLGGIWGLDVSGKSATRLACWPEGVKDEQQTF